MFSKEEIESCEQSILVVDDVPINLKIVTAILETKGYIIITATNAKEALALVNDRSPDLILLDISMPDMDGFELCRILKESYETKDIPLIFLSAKSESDDVVKGFELGAVDYVVKPFNSAELLSRVNTHLELRKLNDIIINYYDRQLLKEIEMHKKLEKEKKLLLQELEGKNKLLQVKVTLDPQTNLNTHDSIVEKLTDAFVAAKRYNYELAIALINIDNMRLINFKAGHQAGSDIIQKISTMLRKKFDNLCEIGRYNGDEFLFIFNQCSYDEAKRKIDVLKENIARLPLGVDGLQVSICAGICSLENENCAHLLKRAEDLLEQAKQKGTNRIEC